jgi:hypothetical protein
LVKDSHHRGYQGVNQFHKRESEDVLYKHKIRVSKIEHYACKVGERKVAQVPTQDDLKYWCNFEKQVSEQQNYLTPQNINKDMFAFACKVGWPTISLNKNDIKITENLGKGGFGLVWRCRAYNYINFFAEKKYHGLYSKDENMAKNLGFLEMVIKAPLISTDVKQAESYIEKMCNEISVLKNLRHINLVRFIGCRFFNKYHGIMMFMSSADLTLSELYGKKIDLSDRFEIEILDESPSEIAKIFYQLATAMQYLHTPEDIELKDRKGKTTEIKRREPVLHRDLKCSNIFLKVYSGISNDLMQPRNWRVKLGDFGLAYLEQHCFKIKEPEQEEGTLSK